LKTKKGIILADNSLATGDALSPLLFFIFYPVVRKIALTNATERVAVVV
jgi:hypothetical protein